MLHAIRFLKPKVGIPAFGAVMRNIHNRCRIVGLKPKHTARFKPAHPLCRFQDRKRAEQAKGVEIVVKLHAPELAPRFQFVHRSVRACVRDLGCRSA